MFWVFLLKDISFTLLILLFILCVITFVTANALNSVTFICFRDKRLKLSHRLLSSARELIVFAAL